MTTLVISTPWYKKGGVGRPGQLNSWEKYFITGKGLGYILYQDEVNTLQNAIKSGSCKLVMLRNDKDE